MNDRELSEAIRTLPRATASPAFNRELLRKLKWRERSRPAAWRLAAAALAVVLSLAAFVQFAVNRHQQRVRLDALRAEQQKIQAELNAVKKVANEAEPVVVLENTDGTRVIMDLDSAIQPASLKTYD